MANLTSAGVTINQTWASGTTPSRYFTSVDATLVLGGQGGGTNLIPAALFGLTHIYNVEAIRSSSKVYVGAPDIAGAGVVLCALSTDTGAFADITDTIRLIVTGT